MKRRICLLKCLAILGSVSISSTVWAAPKGDVWLSKHTPMPSKRVGFSTSAVNGKIYAIGGTDWDDEPRHGVVLRTVEEYDPLTNQWKRREGMRVARSFLATTAANGKIYATGGSVQLFWDRRHVEEYNPVTDTWETKADMLAARSDHFANTVDGKIYVIGPAAHGSVEAYDPAADRWEEKSALPERRSLFATSVVDGKIYVIGGARWNPTRILATVEVYDPASDTWETRADMPTPRFNLSANAVNGIIYAIGGSTDGGLRALPTVEAYNPETDTWETMADMPEGRSGFSSSVVNEKIYVFASFREFRRTVLIYTPPSRPPRSVHPKGKMATTWGQIKAQR